MFIVSENVYIISRCKSSIFYPSIS